MALLALLLACPAFAGVPSSALQELRALAPRAPEPAPLLQPAPARASAPKSTAWTPGVFESPADQALIRYRSRFPAHGRGAPTVFAGGLTVADSYETFFRKPGEPPCPQFMLYFRGQPPTDWAATHAVLSADALDMARMVVRAAQASGASSANLVLHSYATLAFQRMTQYSDDPEVRRALSLLARGKVVMLNGTTHYEGSEASVGWANAELAKNIRRLVDWMDGMDRLYGGTPGWELQKRGLLAQWTAGSAAMTRLHLSGDWGSDDPVRKELARQTERNAFDAGWQEGVLRRTNETSRLEFTKTDVGRLRRLGLALDIVHATNDQLIPWVAQKLFLALLGIRPPEACPAPGTILTDGGRIRFLVVDGDHYFPLKKPSEFDRLLP